MLFGCVPTLSTFYYPYGNGKTGDIGACAMDAAKVLKVSLTPRTNIHIAAQKTNATIHKTHLWINFSIGPNDVVQLVEPTVLVTSKSFAEPFVAHVVEIDGPPLRSSHAGVQTQSPDTPMRGNSGSESTANFGIDIDLPAIDPPEFSVKLPPIKVGIQVVEVPPIDFILTTRPHMIGLCT
jgi:hypothetical protein